jgi:elongation factor G
MSTVSHVISVPLVSADATAALKLRTILDELCADNPSFVVSTGPVNEIVLHSVSELQLEIAVDRLRRHHGLDCNVGAPSVRYLEVITKTIEWDYTHKRQTHGAGEYAKVKIRFEPGEAGSGFVFVNRVHHGEIPSAFVPVIEKGLRAAMDTGTVAGLAVSDLKCTLVDGGYHDVDSTEQTFEIAARACFREALPKAGPRIIEPIMYVAVLTPESHLGVVVGDLNARRGAVRGLEQRGEMQEVNALVPCSNLFGYPSRLLSITRGTAQCMMAFSHYEQVPPYRGPGDDNFPPAIGMRA